MIFLYGQIKQNLHVIMLYIFIVYNSVFLLLQRKFSILLEFHGIAPYSYFKFNNHDEIETNIFWNSNFLANKN